MFDPDQYQLLDFGAGRKLERVGVEILDRPSPAAEGVACADPDAWAGATVRFDVEKAGKGRWDDAANRSPDATDEWSVRHGKSRLLMQLSASGNIGVFPEQADNWNWIADQVRQCSSELSGQRPRMLNLFAYTGGASLTAAAAGAEVTHVDSSAPTVAWAKRNAEASGLADLPLRWLVDDASKFVARECRRGNTYEGIILDPPTYGKGPKGKPFKFREHVGELMRMCGQLIGGGSANTFLLFSCHAPGFGTDDATSAVSNVLAPSADGHVESGPLTLEAPDGRRLSAGVSARWSSNSR